MIFPGKSLDPGAWSLEDLPGKSLDPGVVQESFPRKPCLDPGLVRSCLDDPSLEGIWLQGPWGLGSTGETWDDLDAHEYTVRMHFAL